MEDLSIEVIRGNQTIISAEEYKNLQDTFGLFRLVKLQKALEEQVVKIHCRYSSLVGFDEGVVLKMIDAHHFSSFEFLEKVVDYAKQTGSEEVIDAIDEIDPYGQRFTKKRIEFLQRKVNVLAQSFKRSARN